MALVKPDLSEVKDTVTAGTYKARIRKGEVKEFQSGQQYVNWELETYGEQDPKNNGRRIFHKTPISGGGAFRLQEMFNAATGQALTGEFDTDVLAGKNVQVVVVDGVNRQTGEPTGYPEVKKVTRVTE